MNDRILGVGVLVGSLLGVACYFYLVFLSPWSVLVIQLSAFLAVSAVLVIMAWIGYTLASTPPPEMLDSFPETESSAEEDEGKAPEA